MIDYTDIEKIDLTITPYEWEMENAHGVKAYLKTMYITIRVRKADAESNAGSRPQAETGNPLHVGAPMPGMVANAYAASYSWG